MMTLSRFKDRIIATAMMLEMRGQPTDLESVIWWDSEWHAKWSLALTKGIYDA